MKAYMFSLALVSCLFFVGLMNSQNTTNTSDSLKKGAIVVNAGGALGDNYRANGSPMNLDPYGFVAKGNDIGLSVGLSIPSFDEIPQMGVDFGVGYKNTKGSRHTAYFYGQIDYSPNWYNGYFYAGGAFGGGVDAVKGRTFTASDGGGVTATYQSKDNPKFVYTDFRVGTVYPISRNWSIFGQIQNTGRSYDLGVTASGYESSNNPGFVLDTISAQNTNMTITNTEAYIGIQYRFLP